MCTSRLPGPSLSSGAKNRRRHTWPWLATGESVACLRARRRSTREPGSTSKTHRGQGDRFVLNGEKDLITNADFTDLFMIACSTGPRELGGKGDDKTKKRFRAFRHRADAAPPILGSGHGILNVQGLFGPRPEPTGQRGGRAWRASLESWEASRASVAGASMGTTGRESIEYAQETGHLREADRPAGIRGRRLLADTATDILEDVARKIDEGKPLRPGGS